MSFFEKLYILAKISAHRNFRHYQYFLLISTLIFITSFTYSHYFFEGSAKYVFLGLTLFFMAYTLFLIPQMWNLLRHPQLGRENLFKLEKLIFLHFVLIISAIFGSYFHIKINHHYDYTFKFNDSFAKKKATHGRKQFPSELVFWDYCFEYQVYIHPKQMDQSYGDVELFLKDPETLLLNGKSIPFKKKVNSFAKTSFRGETQSNEVLIELNLESSKNGVKKLTQKQQGITLLAAENENNLTLSLRPKINLKGQAKVSLVDFECRVVDEDSMELDFKSNLLGLKLLNVSTLLNNLEKNKTYTILVELNLNGVETYDKIMYFPFIIK